MENTDSAILKKMADLSDEIFFIFDPENLKIIYINEAFEHFTQKRINEFYEHPKHFLEMIHPEDQQYVKRNFTSLLTNKVNSFLDFRIIRADHVERWVRLKVCPIQEGERVTYLAGTLEDDSARKLGIFNMQKINNWKDAALEILAHDLRGPIGIIASLANAIDQKMPQGENKEIHDWTRTIAEISRRNIKLVQEIIKMQTLETAQVEINRERIELVWEINQLMNVYFKSQLSAEKHFTFTHSHDRIYAEIDNTKYVQIVNNLLSNAVKFTSKRAEISIHLEKLEDTILTIVSDNGIGIPKSLQPFLFEKYTKAARKAKDGQKPIGLGMWIVKLYTDAHGGRIWFESEEHVGSKFYVEIPICKSLERNLGYT